MPLPLVFNKRTIITMTPSNDKLNELRKLMRERDLTAYHIPSEDSHQVNTVIYTICFAQYLIE